MKRAMHWSTTLNYLYIFLTNEEKKNEQLFRYAILRWQKISSEQQQLQLCLLFLRVAETHREREKKGTIVVRLIYNGKICIV